MRLLLALIAFVSFGITDCLAWGSTGHAVVAELAQRRLTTTVTTNLKDLIGGNVSLASIASWADDFKFTPAGARTKRWHFVDIDLYSNDGSWNEDCGLTDQGDCLPYALKREIALLTDSTIGRPARAAALKLVVHLMGDLTQPLHCAERNGDGGGNALQIDFAGNAPDGQPLLGPDKKPLHQLGTLHSLWDDILIGDHVYSFGAYVDELEVSTLPMIPAQKANPDDSDIDGWVRDCHKQALRAYGLLPSGGSPLVLDEKYQKQVQPIVDQQLALGGLRLAAVLNRALATVTSP